MAINTTQPANQKPTGNLYMDSSGKTYSSQPMASNQSSTIPTPTQKNTWDPKIAPASMPGYGGNNRLVANPDYIPGSTKDNPLYQIDPSQLNQDNKNLSQQSPVPPPTGMMNNTIPNKSIPNASGTGQFGSNGQYTYKLDAQGNPTGSPLNQAHQNVLASGTPPPQDGGVGRTAVNKALSQIPTETPSALTPIVDTDKNFDSIFTEYDKFFSPTEQRTSLLDQYKQMESQLGISSMNAELLNTKRIIEGTEDDIRSEVQAVSGFATDSQVMAMAGARNKSLIKNYNYLLEARDSAMTQLNTMMNLSIQDRQMASQEFDRKMNFGFKVLEYKDKMQANAREGYNNIINTLGYDGLYKSLIKDPSSIPVVEKTLGLGAGQLKTLASQPNYKSMKEKVDYLKAVKDLNGGGDKVLSVSEAENLGVPYGTTEKQAQQMKITPGTGGSGVPEKIISKIQSSPENKTINGVLPAIQAIKDYRASVEKYGTFEKLSGKGRGEKDSTYGNAIATWKTLAGLGALSGADFELAENVIPAGGKLFTRNSRQKTQLDNALSNAVVQAENLTNRLIKTYPQAEALLRSQLDDIYLTAYPNKYTRGPDGQVYEIQ
jgi:hypothetical protein